MGEAGAEATLCCWGAAGFPHKADILAGHHRELLALYLSGCLCTERSTLTSPISVLHGASASLHHLCGSESPSLQRSLGYLVVPR